MNSVSTALSTEQPHHDPDQRSLDGGNRIPDANRSLDDQSQLGITRTIEVTRDMENGPVRHGRSVIYQQCLLFIIFNRLYSEGWLFDEGSPAVLFCLWLIAARQQDISFKPVHFVIIIFTMEHLQCFDAVGWAAGRASGLGAGMVVCLGRGADLHMAQLMPLTLTVFCFSKIQIGFTFLVPAHPSNPRQSPEGCEMDVCVCLYYGSLVFFFADLKSCIVLFLS